MEKILTDVSILLEPFVPWKNNEPNYKESALNLITDKFHPLSKRYEMFVSMSIIGELIVVINNKPFFARLQSEQREVMEKTIWEFLRSVKTVGITKETLKLCNEILNLDERVDPLDALHLATALSEKFHGVLLIDNAIKESVKLRGYLKEKGLRLMFFNTKENQDTKYFKLQE